MKKIIVKCRIDSRDQFEDKLSEIDLDFSPIYWQHDRVYVPRGYKAGANYPRLVMTTEVKAVDRPANYTLVLRRHIEDSGIDVVEETPVKDYAGMVNIIMQLGFKQLSEFSMRRQEIRIDEKTVLYLDSIDNEKWYYVKLETEVTDDSSIEETKRELLKTLESLGASDVIRYSYGEHD
jgi:adenylate cyclase class IV